MKLLTTFIATAVLGLSMVSSVQARPAVYFKNPVGWAGTGCKAGTATVIGANTNTLSILFDSYDAGKDSESGRKRTACSFAIPIKVPAGYQVSHLTADWEGYIEGKGQLSRKYFLAGRPFVSWKRNTYNKPNGGNFTKRDNLYHSTFRSSCRGGTFNLRINSQIRALGRHSYAAVDSLDLKNRVLFKLRFRPCRR